MLGLMCAFILMLDTTPYCPPPPIDYQIGYFSQYAQAPTDGTIAYRQSTGELPVDMSQYDGVIATADCSLVGKDAWIKINGSRWLSVIVFDCSGHWHTSAWMEQDNILAEVGFYLAQKYAIVDKGDVRGKLTFEEPISIWMKQQRQ